MKLIEKYHERNSVMTEISEAVMYAMLETHVKYGLPIPTPHDIDIMINKFITLDNPFADKIKEPNLIKNQN